MESISYSKFSSTVIGSSYSSSLLSLSKHSSSDDGEYKDSLLSSSVQVITPFSDIISTFVGATHVAATLLGSCFAGKLAKELPAVGCDMFEISLPNLLSTAANIVSRGED